MAIFNEILSPRFPNMVKKLFSMKGGAGMRQVSGELMAVIPVFNGVENRWLEQWESYGATLGAAAVAANQSATRLRNPSGSGVMAVFEKISVIVGANSDVNCYLGVIGVDLASPAALTNARLDARGRPQPTLVASNQNNAPAAPTFGSEFAQPTLSTTANPYDMITFEDQEIPLLPGDGVQLVCNTVNTRLIVSFMWRERLLEESERQ